MTDSSTISLSTSQVSSPVADEVAILNLADGVYYGLDPVGAFVWRQLAISPRRLIELVDAVLHEYEVEPERCRADVEALLDNLNKRGLVRIDAQ